MRTVFLFIGLFFMQNFCFSQSKPLPEQLVDSVIKVKAKGYKEINDIIRGRSKDTVTLRKIINLFDQKEYFIGKTYALNILGTKYRDISDYAKAIRIHKEALNTAVEANNIEFRVFSLNMLGVDYRRLDANRTALDYNQEALALAETVEEPSLGLRRSIAVSHNSMGNIYLLLKQYDLAIEQFQQSTAIEESINNKLGLAINNQNIGYANEALGNLDEALTYYEKSLALNSSINSKIGKIICNSSIATIYIKQGKAKEALDLIESNLPQAIELGDKYYLSFEYLNLGWAQTKLKDFTNAEKNIQKGLSIAKEYNLPSAIAEAYNHLSELAEQRNDIKNSLKYYKLAEEFDEKISNERTVQYVNDLIIKYDSERKNNQIKVLAKQNEIAELNLTRNRNYWIISLIILGLTLAVLYFLYRQRLHNKEKRILTLEQDMLRVQMNPHFIFNALNSIKLYIINNDKENAVFYLNKFSKLIRQILEASSVKEISLKNELETMNLYMSIENIRFSNEICYSTEVADNVNLEQTKVPSMILQPFLENAIWHGLSSKKGEKTIKLNVDKPETDKVRITIEDNGIGRASASKIKSKKTIKRKSFGIDITKERLENFIKNKQDTFDLQFEDLYDASNNPSGTRLILTLPTV